MLDDPKPEIVFCPNCRRPATRIGNEITCEKCDATFTITRKEAKIKTIGSIQDHEDRISKIEATIFPPENPPPEPEPESEHGSEDTEQTNDILPR